MTAPDRAGGRTALRTLLPVVLSAAAVSALAVGWAVEAAPPSVRTALAWGGGAAGLLWCVTLATAVHALAAARGTRRALRAVAAEADRAAREHARVAEQERQEQQRLSDALRSERARLADEVAAERERLAREASDRVARMAVENRELSDRLDRAVSDRAAVLAATAAAAARMQALATGTLADLRAMEERHSDEDVLADLLHLDHRTAQAGRLADSIAVLTGARSGRRWARPIGMESILRGAMGRISGYQRVRVHSVSEAAVAGHAAEGVMHVLAELLDNAANFSPPTAEVHLYVEEVPAGIIVSVEDSGLVMGEVQLRRAEEAVAGRTAELGGLTGTRLGLAVVGRLARRYGLKVSFRPSARGGTGVLMLIPQEILTAGGGSRPTVGRAGSRPAAAPKAVPAAGVAAAGRADGSQLVGPAAAEAAHRRAGEDTAHRAGDSVPAMRGARGDTAPEPGRGTSRDAAGESGSAPAALPRRRRGRTLAAAEQAQLAARVPRSRPAPPADDVRSQVARFGSFRKAVRAAADRSTGQHPVVRPDDRPPSAPPEAPAGPPAPGGPSAGTPAPGTPAAGPEAPGRPAPGPSASGAQPPSTPSPGNPSPEHAHPEGDTTS